MPDWLKGDEVSSAEKKKQDEEKVRQEIERLEPSPEILTGIGNAARGLMEQIREVNPDIILFTGRSSAFSETLFHVFGDDLRDKQTARLSSALTGPFYGLAESDEGIADIREMLNDEVPVLRLDQSIMIIDDYSATGSKANKFLKAMRRLGFGNVNFAIYSGYDDRDYDDELLVGSQDSELTHYISHLAMMISIGNRNLPDYEMHKPFQEEIRKKTKEVLQKIILEFSQ